MKNINLWLVAGAISLVFGGIILMMSSAHKDMDRLRAECALRGGILIEARNPLYACVQPAAAASGAER